MFKRWDNDGEGMLDAHEFAKLVRTGLRLTPMEVPDAHITALVEALDDDGSGTISISELADFVERGTATFFSGPEAEGVQSSNQRSSWAEQPKRTRKKQGTGGRKKAPIDEAVAKKLQSKLKAACYGTTPQIMFSRWDVDGEGVLDANEFRKLVRTGLKLTKTEVPDAHIDLLVVALDDDASGTIGIEELSDFVERGAATFFADASGAEAPQAMPQAAPPPKSAAKTKGANRKKPSKEGASKMKEWNLTEAIDDDGPYQPDEHDQDGDNVGADADVDVGSGADGGGGLGAQDQPQPHEPHHHQPESESHREPPPADAVRHPQNFTHIEHAHSQRSHSPTGDPHHHHHHHHAYNMNVDQGNQYIHSNIHSNAEHLEHMHESERRDAAAVAEKHELEVTGLRGTIEELETKLAKAEAALVKEQQDREEACGVFQNTIRMLEAENARLMEQQHEQQHATSKEETRLQKALETQARVSKRMEQALTEEVSKLEESRESLRAEHHTHVEDLEAARAREALNSEQVMAKETEKKRLEKELSKYHSRLTRHETPYFDKSLCDDGLAFSADAGVVALRAKSRTNLSFGDDPRLAALATKLPRGELTNVCLHIKAAPTDQGLLQLCLGFGFGGKTPCRGNYIRKFNGVYISATGKSYGGAGFVHGVSFQEGDLVVLSVDRRGGATGAAQTDAGDEAATATWTVFRDYFVPGEPVKAVCRAEVSISTLLSSRFGAEAGPSGLRCFAALAGGGRVDIEVEAKAVPRACEQLLDEASAWC